VLPFFEHPMVTWKVIGAERHQRCPSADLPGGSYHSHLGDPVQLSVGPRGVEPDQSALDQSGDVWIGGCVPPVPLVPPLLPSPGAVRAYSAVVVPWGFGKGAQPAQPAQVAQPFSDTPAALPLL